MNELKVRVTRDDIRKGKPNSSTSCPIARALRRQGFDRIKVDTCEITVGRKKEKFIMSYAAQAFIDDFDMWGKAKPSVFTLTKELI